MTDIVQKYYRLKCHTETFVGDKIALRVHWAQFGFATNAQKEDKGI